jgi:hypothetical protein
LGRGVFLDPVTVEDVAEVLCLTPAAVRTMVHRGELPKTRQPKGWRRRTFRGKMVRIPSQVEYLLGFAVALVRAGLRRGSVRLEELTDGGPPSAPTQPHPDLVKAAALRDEARSLREDAERASRLSARDLERMRRQGTLYVPEKDVVGDEESKPESWSAMGWDLPNEPIPDEGEDG